MKELHELTAPALDAIAADVSSALLALVKRHLVAELTRTLAAGEVANSGPIASAIARRAIHLTGDVADPLPDHGRHFAAARGAMFAAVREAAADLGRAMLLEVEP